MTGIPDSDAFPLPRRGLFRRVPGGALIACTAVVTGDVALGEEVNVWFGAVVRGDEAPIRVGAGTNLQDHCVLHTDTGFPLEIGAAVTVGHGAVLHGSFVGDGSLIGMQATLLGRSRIGAGAVVAAGAVVREGFEVPDGMLAAGVPARVLRPLSQEEREALRRSAPHYVELARSYLEEHDA